MSVFIKFGQQEAQKELKIILKYCKGHYYKITRFGINFTILF